MSNEIKLNEEFCKKISKTLGELMNEALNSKDKIGGLEALLQATSAMGFAIMEVKGQTFCEFGEDDRNTVFVMQILPAALLNDINRQLKEQIEEGANHDAQTTH